MQTFVRWAVIAVLCVPTLVPPASGQATLSHRDEPNPAVGDSPGTAPPLSHFSPKRRRRAIGKAMRKVGDWELKRTREHFDQD